MVGENLKRIRSRIPSQILLIAVSKGQPVEKIAEALAAGQTHFGENYAQELLAHRSWLVANCFDDRISIIDHRGFSSEPSAIHWHFIGHLQRNKVKQILPTVDLIHSVDSLELAKEIDKRAEAIGKIQDILIEINLGNESSKGGFQVGAIRESPLLVQELNQFRHLNLRGFMVIPPAHKDPEASRPYFRQLREIRDEINLKKVYKAPLTELSMGMTNDFEVAIEEGATMVRIGTGIFGDRISPTGVSRVIPRPPLN